MGLTNARAACGPLGLGSDHRPSAQVKDLLLRFIIRVGPPLPPPEGPPCGQASAKCGEGHRSDTPSVSTPRTGSLVGRKASTGELRGSEKVTCTRQCSF